VQRTKDSGLTLIEILIALSLLAIMTGFVVSALAGSFQITRASRKALDANASVQRVIEEVRGRWQVRDLYNASCAIIDLTPDSATFLTLSATSLALTASAGTATGATPTNLAITGCAIPPYASPVPVCAAPMRRVVVTAVDNTDSNRVLASATLDVVCP
jgi:prepilin-type N-terminal cleavage/methylation domain-containing protein